MRAGAGTAFAGITRREALRFANQRERFLAALVRPLVWLFIFAAGFRSVLGLSITPPYQTYVLYEVYVTPGLIAMIQLFNGMQSSLSMVYDRETGSMRTLLTSPFPRWFLLVSKLVAGVAVSILQVYAFLAIAWWWGIRPPPLGLVTVLPALALSGMMLGSFGLLLSSTIRQYFGDSRGRWEGDTLVVEVTNFPTNIVNYRGATGALHVTERFRRVDAATVRYEVTVSDPATFARPWTAAISMPRWPRPATTSDGSRRRSPRGATSWCPGRPARTCSSRNALTCSAPMRPAPWRKGPSISPST